MATLWSARGISLMLVGVFVACAAEPPAIDEAGRLVGSLPIEVDGWQASGEDEIYDTESIFSYIDGHAEVYLAYGMKRCLARRYRGPENAGDIVLDLFELESSEDAFGVFTQDRDGEDVDVGQGALLRPGWLSFWKGRWFGSVYAEVESESSRAAVTAIATAAAAVIDEEGAPPSLIAALPANGLEQRSVRFLHTQGILNTAVFVGTDNFLGLDRHTDGALGQYRFEDGNAWLLLVDYPTDDLAAGAEEGARAAGLAVHRTGARLAVVLAAEPAGLAADLLAPFSGG